MTKEDILEKRIITFPSDDSMNHNDIKRNVLFCMEEYANQFKSNQ